MILNICVTCSVKTPPLLSLSDEHWQLLEAIVAPFVNMDDLKASRLLLCMDCQVKIVSIHKFQKTALNGIRNLKYLLCKVNNAPPSLQPLNPEAKSEQITIKVEPENDLPTIKQEFISVSAPEDKNLLSEEIDVKFEPESKTKPDYDSAVRSDGIPDPISHPDPDPYISGSAGSSFTGMQSMINNIIPLVQANPGFSNSVYRVYAKKPEPESILKNALTTVKPIQTPKLVQLAKNRRKVTSVRIPIDSEQKVLTKRIKAEKADKMAPKENEDNIPELISQDSGQVVREGSKRKKRKRLRILKDVSCPHCDKTYKGNQSLKVHMKRFHVGLKPSPCETCGKLYRNETALKWHIKMTHEQIKKIKTAQESNPEFFCAECTAQFPSRGAYKAHLMSLKHTPREQYTFECEICKTKFPTRSRLREHIDIVHLKKKPYKCEMCGKAYCAAYELREHVRFAHEKQAKKRPHVCHLCGRSFTVSKCLQEHLLSHQGLRPFKCELCHATFTYSAALYNHNKIKHLKIKRKLKKKKEKEAGVEDAGGVEKEAGKMKSKRRKVGKGAWNVNIVVGEVEKDAGELQKTKVEKERDVDKEASGVEKESEQMQKELEDVGDDADSSVIDSYFDTNM